MRRVQRTTVEAMTWAREHIATASCPPDTKRAIERLQATLGAQLQHTGYETLAVISCLTTVAFLLATNDRPSSDSAKDMVDQIAGWLAKANAEAYEEGKTDYERGLKPPDDRSEFVAAPDALALTSE